MHIFITAFNRQNSLSELIEGLNYPYDKIVIVDDHSEPALETPNGVEVIRTEQNNGKELFYRNINIIFDYIKRKNEIKYFMIIPDDFLPFKDWMEVYNQFKHIEQYDDKAVALTVTNRRWRKHCFTGFPKKTVNIGNKKFLQTQYVDGDFIANRRFLEAIDFQVKPTKIHKENLSSGVWRQVSKKLSTSGRMYSVSDNNYFEMNTGARKDSKMHKWIRKPRKVVASCATMPSRVEHLEKAINSLIDQVDEIRCYLNNFDTVPTFLDNPKIKVYRSQDEVGDLTDRGKFYKCEEIEGYFLTFDDDIIYPSDYVEKMIQAIDEYGGVCTYHGRKLQPFKHFNSYYQGAAKEVVHCKHSQGKDIKLDIPGTGVQGFHTDDIQFSINDFWIDCMADIFVGIKCRNEGIPITGLSHKEGYFTIQKIDIKQTIFGQHKYADDKQVELLNKYFTT